MGNHLFYHMFESDVISDGTQTVTVASAPGTAFESDVISDGIQTKKLLISSTCLFERDVISDGAQTQIYSAKRPLFRH